MDRKYMKKCLFKIDSSSNIDEICQFSPNKLIR